MQLPTRSSLSGTLVIVALLAAGCSESSAGPSADEDLASIVLISPPTSLAIGATVQLAATTLNSQGAAITGHPVSWESQQPAVASVTPSGAVTGLTSGTATIRALSGSRSASVTLTVARAPCTSSTAIGTFAPGQPSTGGLDASDCMLQGGTPAEGRRLTLGEATTLRIELSSAQFDPLVLVTDQAMNPIIGAGGGGPGTVARLLQTFGAGTYYVWATSFSDAASGSFTLAASPVTMCEPAVTAGAIIAGQTVSGALTDGSCLLPNFQKGQGWAFSLAETTVLRFDAQGNGILPVLIATGTAPELPIVTIGFPSGQAATSFIHSFAPGEYRLWVASLDDTPGNYTLSMSVATLPSCDEIEGPIAVGQAVQGALTIDDCGLPDGRHADLWELTLAAPATLRVDQMSQALDSYLIIRDGAGVVIAEDDDGGDFLNSRIERPFAAGTYRITSTSFMPMAVGAYQLSVQVALPGLRQEGGSIVEPTLKRVVPVWERW